MIPVGKARARVTRLRTYTPKKTVDAERLIGWECKKAMAGRKPFEGPISLRIDFCFSHPASWSQKRREATYWKITKPDADNLTKTVKDSLNKIAWLDDAQVVVL